MKRYSREEHLRRAHHAHKAWQKKLRRKHKTSMGSYTLIHIHAPKDLSFSTNGKKTLEFLEGFRREVFYPSRQIKRKGEVFPCPIRLHLEDIARISVPTAIVLAAELHRWSLHKTSDLRLHASKKWTPRLRSMMADLGVVNLLNISTKRSDRDPLQKLQGWLKAMEFGFEEKRYVFGSLDEAVINCIDHGYVDTGEPPPYPSVGNRCELAPV